MATVEPIAGGGCSPRCHRDGAARSIPAGPPPPRALSPTKLWLGWQPRQHA